MTEQEKERARRFGAYIRQLRVARGMTQQELATKCGYGHTTDNELRLAQTKLNEVFEALW